MMAFHSKEFCMTVRSWRIGLLVAFGLACGPAFAADLVALPQGEGDYARLVARAAAGDTALDFRALRVAAMANPHRAGEMTLLMSGQALIQRMESKDYDGARRQATETLTENYTDFFSWEILGDACESLGDKACAAQALFMQKGLMQSVLNSGDGKSCATGWVVVTNSEENDLMLVMGPQRTSPQRIKEDGHSCDVMATRDLDGKPMTFYFNADAIVARGVE